MSFSRRLAVVGGVFALYSASFVAVFPTLGYATGIVSILPVMAAAWLLGTWPGIAAAVFTLPLNYVLYGWSGATGDTPWAGLIPGTVVWVLIVLGIGWRTRLIKVQQRQAQELVEERERLHQTQAELRRAHAELEQRVAERTAALVRAEENLRVIVERAPIPMALIDLTGAIQRVNEAFTAMLGYRTEELYGRRFAEITHPDDLNGNLQLFQQLLAGDIANYQIEERYLHQAGHIVATILHATVLRDGHGQAVQVVGQIIDITERQKMEAGLRQLNADLEQRVAERTDALSQVVVQLQRQTRLIDQSQTLARVGGWEIDLRSGEMYWTPEMYRLLGHAPETFSPTTHNSIAVYAPESIPAIITVIEKATLTGEPWDIEVELVTAAGQRFWARSIGRANLEVGKLYGTFQDITERKQAEAEYRSLFENTPIGLYRSSPEGRQLRANPALVKLNGYASEAEQITAVNDIGSEWYVDANRRAEFKRALAEQGRVVDFESEIYRHKTRERIWVSESALIVYAADGEPLYYEGTVQDITERKRAEQAMLALNTELAAKNREMETFTYSVSHDLKAPLRGIDGYSRILLEDYSAQLDAEGRRYLRTIRSATDQMGQLITDLLAYSRLERRALAQTPLGLHEVLMHVLAEKEAEVKERGARITVEVDGLQVSADRDGLAQAIRNLVDNALKFTRPVAEPSIEIGALGNGDTVTLWVRDNGIGFEMHYHDRIFGIFQRLHRPEEYPGTGVGLALVRKAMERMGGRVWADSAPGQGATFYLELPKAL